MDKKEHLEPFILGYCKCGCQTPIKIRTSTKKRRLRRYVHGHNGKGKLRPEATAWLLGDKHWNWKGGRHKDSRGYWYHYKPKHHFAIQLGYVMEHRLVWEEYNKASLLPWAAVHHMNGIKTDNRIENLEAMMSRDHKSMHMKEIKPWLYQY